MTALVLDAGALVAVDRGDRPMMARPAVAQQHGLELRSNAMVAARYGVTGRDARPVWRDCCARWMSAPSVTKMAVAC